MDDLQFDITPEELDPTFLFCGRLDRTEDENNYHNHDFVEMSIMLEGHGTYRVNDEVINVKEGDVLIFNPGIYHEAIVANDDEKRVEFFIGFMDIHLKEMEKDQIVLKDGSRVLSLHGKTKREVERLCQTMHEENLMKRPGRYLMHKSCLIQLLLLIEREELDPFETVKGCSFEYLGKKDIADKVANYLEDHYSEKITLDLIAENMYMSPYYISKLFKAEMGTSPIRYVIQLRMERAGELLKKEQQMPISEVAAAVGYDDVFHFSKVFKKEFGTSPSIFRKNQLKN